MAAQDQMTYLKNQKTRSDGRALAPISQFEHLKSSLLVPMWPLVYVSLILSIVPLYEWHRACALSHLNPCYIILRGKSTLQACFQIQSPKLSGTRAVPGALASADKGMFDGFGACSSFECHQMAAPIPTLALMLSMGKRPLTHPYPGSE